LGQRKAPPPPRPEQLGTRAPNARELGVTIEEVFEEMGIMEREKNPNEQRLPTTNVPRSEWPLHMKPTPRADIAAVVALPTLNEGSKAYLHEALRYTRREIFEGMKTSRTIKPTRVPWSDIERGIECGAYEEVTGTIKEPLPQETHGVNLFDLPELKQRRRHITEPLLNGCIAKHELPLLRYPTRLERRQALKKCKYMIQLDMDSYYNSIPLDDDAKLKFVFKKSNRYFALRTTPTGGRWSVSVGQAITWAITDIATGIVVFSMIDNIMHGGEEGQEQMFLSTVREIAKRTQRANLQITPRAETILGMSDNELLQLAEGENTFLGEVYTWDNERKERTIRNSMKTVAKLRVALRKEVHTFRTFVALISLVLYAMHTTGCNPASAFHILRAYRGAAAAVNLSGGDWDSLLPFVSRAARDQLTQIGRELTANEAVRISSPHSPTYDEDDYSDVIYTDASANGWAALHKRTECGTVTLYQQMWTNDLSGMRSQATQEGASDLWVAKFSAHAEPGAVLTILRHLESKGRLGPRRAVVTDHFPIEHAQRGTNGFGGIGRGQTLNRLYEYAYSRTATVQQERSQHQQQPSTSTSTVGGETPQTTFFFIAGVLNPADEASRNFGAECAGGTITEVRDNHTRLPPLRTCFSHLCESGEPRPQWMK
jgi:hypothetical protein